MITIRKATCQDGQLISHLLLKKYSFSSPKLAIDTYNHECSYQHYRIAVDNKQVVGLICWRVQGSNDHGVAELTRFAIDMNSDDPKYIKELLFDQMVAEADYYYKQRNSKLRKIFSMIHSDDKIIKEFFQNKGMQQEAILRNHYHNGQDELIFSLFFA